mmetsp:Transcript_62992/g.99992  ORF Transcript_62992/g.99992 Transcript_62992/m.99992 type:complete len:196 (+) Transcript_62992:49-636(+)
MVSLGVPTARFGLPPDPSKPAPHYPGVSSIKFDAVGALKVYRESLKRGDDIRANQLYLQAEREWPIRHRRRLEDLMPGLASVAETYQHMGYTPDPITRRMVPPVAEPPKLDLSSEASGSRRGSRCSKRGSHHSSRTGRRSSKNLLRGSSLPAFKSHFDAPEGGICCLSHEQREGLQKEKDMILKSCGQSRVFTFV